MPVLYDKYKQQPGPKPKRKPITVTNPNDPRLKAYSDSLKLYNTNFKSNKEITDALPYYSPMDPQKIKSSIKPLSAYQIDLDRIKKDNAQNYMYLPKYDNKGREIPHVAIAAGVYKKPVQPVVYQKLQQASVQQNKYPKSLDPNYEYSSTGKLVLIPKPQERKDYPLRGPLPKAQAKINIAAPQQTRIPDPEGDYIYGPANSVIGTNTKNGFVPWNGVNQRGTVNNPDTELLANPEGLKSYLAGKGIQYKYGGSMSTLYTAYRKNKLAGGGSLYAETSSIETEIPPVIGGGSRGYMPKMDGGVSDGRGVAGSQGTIGTSATRAGNKVNWGAAAGGVAAIGTELIDSNGKGDPLTGRKSIGSNIAKGALSGAATGTSIMPGWGTLIGAVVGGAAGWISGGSKRRKARVAMNNEINANRTDAINYSANLAASNPSLYEGYRGAEYYGKYGGKMTKFATGGTTSISAPLASMYMNGGKAKSISSDNAELIGNSHKQGGIHIPEMNAEVEGGETTVGDYVFSKKLGFADIHRPIAKAKGKIEAKPATKERINALRRLKDEEQSMVMAQEYFKKQLKIA